MKNLKAIAFILIASIGILNAQESSKKDKKQVNYHLDKEKTTVKWTGKKVGGAHNGKIAVLNGNVLIVDGNISRGHIDMDMNSITCDDIEDKEYNEKLINHLKNEDFFHTDLYPISMLDITHSEKKGEEYKITANLTLKGITNPIEFEMKIEESKGVLTAKGKIVFDRTMFNVKYGSTLFGAAVDKAIDNLVELDIVFVGEDRKN